MAVSIVNKPQLFSPVGNPVIWVVSSDADNFLYFKLSIEDDASDVLLNTKIYPTPDYPTGSYINLSRILDNYVKWDIDNDSFIYSADKSLYSYKLVITEVYSVSGIATAGDTLTTDVAYVWNAGFNRSSFNKYSSADYVLQDENIAQFLTNKPDKTYQNELTGEYLYFLSKGDISTLKVQIQAYNNSGGSNSYSYDISSFSGSGKMLMINLSPVILESILSIDFTNVSYYTVQVVDGSGNSLTEIRTYLYQKFPCYLEPVNILFVNSLGAFDSYQFVNPQQTVGITRTTIQKNPYKLDIFGNYSNITGNIYNPSEEITNIDTSLSYTVYSRPLSDNEAAWLTQLFTTKQAFIEAADKTLIPILIQNTSYPLQRLKYLQGTLNTIQLRFTILDSAITIDNIKAGNGTVVLMDNDSTLVTDSDNTLIITK